MNLHETHILCEALESYIARGLDSETKKIAKQLLSRYTEQACEQLYADYRALERKHEYRALEAA